MIVFSAFFCFSPPKDLSDNLVGLSFDRNEELLRQALTLNDDLKRVLAKHDAIQSGAPLPKESSTAPPPRVTSPSPFVGNRSQKDSDDVLSQLTHRSNSYIINAEKSI